MESMVRVQAARRVRLWTVPNQITAVRLVLSVVVFGAIAWQWYRWGLALFLIAAATDWVDGFWARRYGEVTKVGRIFDPFVDKLIICGAFIMLAAQPGSLIAAWMAVVVVARELLVTALRSAVEGAGGDFSAKWSGKIKMVVQCGAVAGSLSVLAWQPEPPSWWARLVLAVIWVALASTVYSGGVYVKAAWEALRAPKSGADGGESDVPGAGDAAG